MADLYMTLNYEDYKNVERQMKAFEETSHGKGTDYYHHSIRIKVNENLTFEFNGPVVRVRQQEDVGPTALCTLQESHGRHLWYGNDQQYLCLGSSE